MMIKKILIEALKIVLILSIGQIPMGRSTLGGEFIRHAKKGFSQLPQEIEKWGNRAGLKGSRSLSSKSENAFELMRKSLSKEEIREEESAAIQNLLEEEEE